MIDSTTSPVPTWKRYLTIAVLAVVVLAAGYLIYTKELKGSSGSSSANIPAVTIPAAGAGAASAGSPSGSAGPTLSAGSATTIPGGVAPSSRNPFSP